MQSRKNRNLRFRIFSAIGIPMEEDPRNGRRIKDPRRFGIGSKQ